MATDTPPSKRLLRVLAGESLTPPPIWLMRQAGRYLPEYRDVRATAGDFLTLCYTPEFAVEVTLQPIRRYGFDAAILFSDILVIPDALGQPVRFATGEGPILEAIETADAAENLSLSRIDEHLAPVFETVRGLRQSLPAETTLIGFAGAPWTILTYMIGGRSGRQSRALELREENPALFNRLLDLVTEATGRYLARQVDHGAEVLQIFDSWASSVPGPLRQELLYAPVETIADYVHALHPTVPIIIFPRGVGNDYVRYAQDGRYAGVSVDQATPPAWMATHLAPHTAVQGNLDPALLIEGGAALDDAITQVLAAMRGTRHIFNLGHGITPQTPPDNVARLVDLVRANGS